MGAWLLRFQGMPYSLTGNQFFFRPNLGVRITLNKIWDQTGSSSLFSLSILQNVGMCLKCKCHRMGYLLDGERQPPWHVPSVGGRVWPGGHQPKKSSPSLSLGCKEFSFLGGNVAFRMSFRALVCYVHAEVDTEYCRVWKRELGSTRGKHLNLSRYSITIGKVEEMALGYVTQHLPHPKNHLNTI